MSETSIEEAERINAILARSREEQKEALAHPAPEEAPLDRTVYRAGKEWSIDKDGIVNIFDPYGDRRSNLKAREFREREALPKPGELADVIESGPWNNCDGIIFERVAVGAPETGAAELRYWDGKIYQTGAEAIIGAAVQTILGRRCKKGVVDETIAYIERRHPIVKEVESHGLICLDNGILDIYTKKLTPFSSQYVFISSLPITYDPGAECYAISSFMRDVLDTTAQEDGTLLDYSAMLEFLGTCLEPGQVHQKGVILVGSGHNGKSVLLDMINRWLGAANVSAVSMEDLGGGSRFAAADLYGKMANICADITAGEMKDTATLKKAIGNDVISAEKKYGQPFKFKCSAKMLFSCNHIPASKDLSLGWVRRWLLFDFPRTFTPGVDADPHILDKLCTPAEFSGLLNLALEGLARLRKQGYFTGHQDMEKDRERYLMAADPCAKFLATRTFTQLSDVYEDGINMEIPAIPVDDLYERLVEWCVPRRVTPPTPQYLTKRVQEVFPGISRTRRWIGDRKAGTARYVYVWYGLGLSPEE